MSTTRPAQPRAGGASSSTCLILISALLFLTAILVIAAGPELLAWARERPGTRLLPFYLLAAAAAVKVAILLFRGGDRLGGAGRRRVLCRKCGAANDGHARFCNQCAAPI